MFNDCSFLTLSPFKPPRGSQHSQSWDPTTRLNPASWNKFTLFPTRGAKRLVWPGWLFTTNKVLDVNVVPRARSGGRRRRGWDLEGEGEHKKHESDRWPTAAVLCRMCCITLHQGSNVLKISRNIKYHWRPTIFYSCTAYLLYRSGLIG